MKYPRIHSFYDTAWLIENHEISQCINEAVDQKGNISFSDFYYHWDNFELTHQLNWCPSEKQVKQLVDCVKLTRIPNKYYDPWWPKVKAVIDDGAENPMIWGQMVDRFTCSMIYNVMTALNETNFKKLSEMEFPIAHGLIMQWYGEQRA